MKTIAILRCEEYTSGCLIMSDFKTFDRFRKFLVINDCCIPRTARMKDENIPNDITVGGRTSGFEKYCRTLRKDWPIMHFVIIFFSFWELPPITEMVFLPQTPFVTES